jgi:hypothetical protein
VELVPNVKAVLAGVTNEAFAVFALPVVEPMND